MRQFHYFEFGGARHAADGLTLRTRDKRTLCGMAIPQPPDVRLYGGQKDPGRMGAICGECQVWVDIAQMDGLEAMYAEMEAGPVTVRPSHGAIGRLAGAVLGAGGISPVIARLSPEEKTLHGPNAVLRWPAFWRAD